MQGPTFVGFIPLIVLAVLVVGTMVYFRRTGASVMAAKTIVRCAQGHLFTTIWLPGASFKSIRLGLFRFQRCPVGNHFTLVHPINPSSLTPEARRQAEAVQDTRIP